MGFNKVRVDDNGRVKTPIVKSNTTYREKMKLTYENYCQRISEIAAFFNWEENSPGKLEAVLNFPGYASQASLKRLEMLEEEMRKKQEESLLSMSEYKKSKKDCIVFQLVSKNNEVRNIGISLDDPIATPLYEGLVFRNVSIENSPFKTEENLRAILKEYEEKKIENEKEEAKLAKTTSAKMKI